MPSISVVIPAYNSQHTLYRSIESLLNQTNNNFEIVIVDDGSIDCCGILCDDYAKISEKVFVIHQHNNGTSKAKNVGVSISNALYLLFLDSDDYYDYDTIEILNNVIERYHPDCICFGLRYIINQEPQCDAVAELEHNRVLGRDYIKSVILPPLLNIKKDEARFIFDFAVNKVYRENILRKNNILFDETRRTWEDRPFIVHYLKYCESFYSLDRALYNYVQTKSSLSTKYFLEYFDIILENYHNYSTWFAGKYDFDNQYSNDYWCRSIENMILRSLEQTEHRDKIQNNMLRILSNTQVQHWFENRIPRDKWERKASLLVSEKKYKEAIVLYRRKLSEIKRKNRGDKTINLLKYSVRRLLIKG